MSASVWTPGTTLTPSLPAVSPVQFVPGTEALPGITFVGDTNTGIFSAGDGAVALSSNGAAKLITSSSGVEVPNGTLKLATEATIASAATCDIGAVASNSMTVTGSAVIGSLGTTYSGPKFLRFTGAAVLNYSVNLILPGAASITATAGDCAIFVPKATAGTPDGWVCVSYQYGDFASGRALLDVYSTAETDAAINAAIATGAFRNRIVNGDFSIDSEHQGAFATIPSTNTLKHIVDGWYGYATGSTISTQKITFDGKDLILFTGASGNTLLGFATRILSEDSADIVGSNATLAIKMYSTTPVTVNWQLYHATTKDSFGTVASPTRTSITSGSFVTTSTEITYPAITPSVLPADAWKGLELVFTISGLGSGNVLAVRSAQLEKGSIATPVFEVLPKERQNLRCLYRAGRINILVTTTSFSQQAAYNVIPRVTPVLTLINFNTGTGATVSNNTHNNYTNSIIQNAAHSAIAVAQYYYDARP